MGAGVGDLTLVDGDRPAVSDLHRQPFLSLPGDQYKAELLARHCQSLNPGTRVSAITEYLGSHNAKDLVSNADIVLDCTDDAATKHLLSDVSHLLHVPLVYCGGPGF